jgi:predicted nucleotidyltransferase
MSELKSKLISSREAILESFKKLFDGKAIEAHLFGSIARGDADAYSDIDIWFTFNDVDTEEVLKNRFDYYAQIGEILHICEPPQNAPIDGVQSSITYKTEAGYLTVDCSLCPLSTATITEEGKKLYGVDLPTGTMGYNPNKVQVPESYRIDFFTCFLLNAVKKLARHQENPLEAVFHQYENLHEKYSVPVEPLTTTEQSFDGLKQVIGQVWKVATKKQQEALSAVADFIEKVK